MVLERSNERVDEIAESTDEKRARAHRRLADLEREDLLRQSRDEGIPVALVAERLEGALNEWDGERGACIERARALSQAARGDEVQPARLDDLENELPRLAVDAPVELRRVGAPRRAASCPSPRRRPPPAPSGGRRRSRPRPRRARVRERPRPRPAARPPPRRCRRPRAPRPPPLSTSDDASFLNVSSSFFRSAGASSSSRDSGSAGWRPTLRKTIGSLAGRAAARSRAGPRRRSRCTPSAGPRSRPAPQPSASRVPLAP